MARNSNSKPNTEPKAKRVSKPARISERLANARKIGTRDEVVIEQLSPSQIDEERTKVCLHLREIDVVKTAKREANDRAKARITELENAIASGVRVANAGKRDAEIVVEEWLTGRNEVIRVRTDTGEIIGTRNASLGEMQEELFGDGDGEDADDDDEDTGSRPVVVDAVEPDAAHIAEVAADMREAGEDFGDELEH